MTNARGVGDSTAPRKSTPRPDLEGQDEEAFLVPADAPIVTAVNADRSFLKPGEYVYLNAAVSTDGRLTAVGRIQVSKDGVRARRSRPCPGNHTGGEPG